MRYWILPLFLGALGLATGALGQPGHHRGRPDGERCTPPHLQRVLPIYDQNGNGQLEPFEHHTMMEDRRKTDLERFDLDRDGRLDEREFLSMHQAHRREHFDALDRDRDGSITLLEAQGSCTPLERGFERVDTNSDGSVSFEEFERHARPPRHPAR